MQTTIKKARAKKEAVTLSIAGVNVPDISKVLKKVKRPETLAETRLRRLKKLRYLMLNHDKIFPQIDFDLNTWWDGDSDELQHGSTNAKDCGTAACALGSAACYKPFIEEGLHLDERGHEPVYKGTTDWSAGGQFFGITYEESLYLFEPDKYEEDGYWGRDITPEVVAERVSWLIKKYTPKKPKGDTHASK